MKAISILKRLLLILMKFNFSICYMKSTRFNVQRLERYNNIGLQRAPFSSNCEVNRYKSSRALNSEKSNDYEFLDCGNLKRLERFGGVTVVRSCPSAIWPVKLSNQIWNNVTNVAYDGTSGKVGKWSGLENIRSNWSVMFPSSRLLISKQKEKELLNKKDDISIDNLQKDDMENNDNVNLDTKPLVFTLSCSDQGQVGVFPEQQDNWIWIRDVLQQPVDPSETEEDGGTSRKILNGFAYTGGSSLAALSTDISLETLPLSLQVVHLDAAKASVQWAMRNAIASGLINSDNENDNSNSGTSNGTNKNNDATVSNNDDTSSDERNDISILDNKPTARFIIDDCTTFLEREVRRGNKYDGLIFDPPAFGRASSGMIYTCTYYMIILRFLYA
jgi:23S rRNA (cytosine1962-C5)-methyltransferase